MTSRCIIEGCSTSICKDRRSSFNFPSDEEKLKNWMLILGMEDKPKPFSKVCEKHFTELELIRIGKAKNELYRPALHKNALPTVALCPPYKKTRESPAVKLLRINHATFINSLQEQFDENGMIESFDDLKLKIEKKHYANWFMHEMNDCMFLMRLDFSADPEIRSSIKINRNCDLSVSLGKSKLSKLGHFTIPKSCTSLSIIKTVINNIEIMQNKNNENMENKNNERMEKKNNETTENMNNKTTENTNNETMENMNNKTIEKKSDECSFETNILTAISILSNILDLNRKTSSLNFIIEQLKLMVSKKNFYSPETMVFASHLSSISQKSYNFLQTSDILTLPAHTSLDKYKKKKLQLEQDRGDPSGHDENQVESSKEQPRVYTFFFLEDISQCEDKDQSEKESASVHSNNLSSVEVAECPRKAAPSCTTKRKTNEDESPKKKRAMLPKTTTNGQPNPLAIVTDHIKPIPMVNQQKSFPMVNQANQHKMVNNKCLTLTTKTLSNDNPKKFPLVIQLEETQKVVQQNTQQMVKQKKLFSIVNQAKSLPVVDQPNLFSMADQPNLFSIVDQPNLSSIVDQTNLFSIDN